MSLRIVSLPLVLIASGCNGPTLLLADRRFRLRFRRRAGYGIHVNPREGARGGAEELAPYIEAALARKHWMEPIADADIPVVRASVKQVEVNQDGARG